MRLCDLCGMMCDSQIGLARELVTNYWGGVKDKTVEYSGKLVSFFCSEDHRSEFLVSGLPGGHIQTRRGEVIENEIRS